MDIDIKNVPDGSENQPQRKNNPGQLWVTGLIGLVFWVIGEFFFQKLTGEIYTPLGITIYFLLFSLVIAVAYLMLSAHKRKRDRIKRKLKETQDFIPILVAFAVLIAGAFVFEFLYELGESKTFESTSYVFLIDDSGSMGSNDSENRRVTAIDEIMKNDPQKLPYAVYRFDSGATLVREMGPYNSVDQDPLPFVSQGGTEILGSLETVVNDHKSGVLNGGAYPRVLLLSDGTSTQVGLRSTVRACTANGISVSAIGFGSCNEGFLQKIANSTGGVYVYADDIATLKDDMQQALVLSAERNLLSERFPMPADWLYACMRIVFLFLLSLVWGYYRLMLLEDPVLSEKQLIMFLVVCGALAALAMEFLTLTTLSANIVRLIFCVLWSLMPGGKLVYPLLAQSLAGDIDDPLPGGDIFGVKLADGSKINQKHDPTAPKDGSIDFEKDPNGNDGTVNPFATDNPFSGNPFADDPTSGNPFGGNSDGNPFGPGGDNCANPFGGGSDNPFG